MQLIHYSYQKARNADCHGNLLLCRLVGATLITVTDLEGLTQHENINRTYRLMEEFSEKLKCVCVCLRACACMCVCVHVRVCVHTYMY